MQTCNIYMYIYWLVLAYVSFHFGVIFIFSHLCPWLCKCYYQRLNVWALYTLIWGLYIHYSSSAVEHAMWEPYFSVIYVKCVYNASCCMVDCSDVICGIYMCLHLPYKPIIYLAYIAYMDTCISSKHLAVTCKVCIAVGWFLAHMCTNVGLYAHLTCWWCDLHLQCVQPYLFSDRCQICVQWHWE